MPGPTDEARALQQIQGKALLAMYDSFDGDCVALGVNTATEKSVRAKAEYQKTVDLLVALLGTEAHCNHVDQDKWGYFSDFHKSIVGFRPRDHYSVAMVETWLKAHT